MRFTPRHKAFTLVELLVATAIIGLIVTAVYGSYYVSWRSITNCRTKLNHYQQGRSLVENMSLQIRSAYNGKRTINTNEKDHSTDDILSRDITISFEGKENYLQLITTTAVFHDSLLPHGPYLAAYKYDQTNQTVYYRQDKILPGIKDQELKWLIVAQKVTKFKLSFYDGRQWKNKWLWNNYPFLPQAVKIDLELNLPQKPGNVFNTIVPVYCSKKGIILP